MNLKQRMIQSVALAIGLMVMSIVAAVPETSVATSGEVASLQGVEVATGRTAGVILALNLIEEESLESYTLIGVEQIRGNMVTASVEENTDVSIDTYLGVEEVKVVLEETEVVAEPAAVAEVAVELVAEPATEVVIELVSVPETEAATELLIESEIEAATELVVESETEIAAEVVVEPVLSEEEMVWQNRVMADVKKQMNVRAEASGEAELVGRFRKGDVAEVIEKGEEWTKIRSGNVEGYVKNSYCVYGLDALAYAKENVDTRATVTVNGLRVRSEASTESGSIIASVSKGATLIVDTEAEVPEGWVAVGYTGKTRYVSSEYVEVQFATTEAITIAEEKEIERKKAEEEAKRKAAQTTEITVVQRDAYGASTDEILLLAALIQCEAGGESYEGKLAVGAVVMNRVRSSHYPNTIGDVIYSPGQFTPAANGKVASVLENGPKDSCIQAAQEAVNGVDNTNGAKSFRNKKSGHAGLVIGGHVFF